MHEFDTSPQQVMKAIEMPTWNEQVSRTQETQSLE
jgi:hypothetical protein